MILPVVVIAKHYFKKTSLNDIMGLERVTTVFKHSSRIYMYIQANHSLFRLCFLGVKGHPHLKYINLDEPIGRESSSLAS